MFEILGQQLEIPKSTKRYNKLRVKYQKKAEILEYNFIKVYKDEKLYLDTSLNKLEIEIKNIISKEIYEIIDELIRLGFSNINVKEFENLYYKNYFEVGFIFEKIKREYFEIKLSEQVLDDRNRTIYRNNSFQKSRVLKDKNIIKLFSNKLYYSIFGMHLAFIHFLRKNNDFSFNVINQENVIEGLILFEKFKKYKNLEDILKSIKLNPYNRKAYEYLIQTFGDDNQEIRLIANYFGIHIETENLNINQNLTI